MDQFILQQNVQRLRRAIETETNPTVLDSIRKQLTTDQRDLALITAKRSGVLGGLSPVQVGSKDRAALRSRFEEEFRQSPDLCLLIDTGPGLAIADVNSVFEQLAMVRRQDVVGRPLFDVFPENPGEPTADGVSSVYQSLRRVAETGRSNAMALLRYDLRDPDGAWQERYWLPVNTPIFDIGLRLAFILLRVRPANPDEVAQGHDQARP